MLRGVAVVWRPGGSEDVDALGLPGDVDGHRGTHAIGRIGIGLERERLLHDCGCLIYSGNSLAQPTFGGWLCAPVLRWVWAWPISQIAYVCAAPIQQPSHCIAGRSHSWGEVRAPAMHA